MIPAEAVARGLVKVDCDTALERAFVGAGLTLTTIAVLILSDVYLYPPTHAHQVLRSVMPVVMPGLVGGALVFFALRLLTDNYYLVDPSTHTVYFHFDFLFIRHDRLLLEHKDIIAT